MENHASSIVVLLAVHNRIDLSRRCLGALREAAGSRHLRFLVIDDGSTDGTAEWLAGEPDVTALRGDGNLWFGGAVDLGLRHLLADGGDCADVLILNNDTFVQPAALDALAGASGPDTVTTAAFWIEDRQIVGSSGFLWRSWRGLEDACLSEAWRAEQAMDRGRFIPVDAVATTLTFIPRALLRRARLPDPRLHPHNRYDAILSARLRAAGARFLCSTALLATHLYGPMAGRPTVRTMRMNRFLHESFRDRRTVHHLAGGLALAAETAPSAGEAVWAVLGRMARFSRQLAWVTFNSLVPRSAKLQSSS